MVRRRDGELTSMLDARIPSVKRRALQSTRVAERAGVVHRTSGNRIGSGVYSCVGVMQRAVCLVSRNKGVGGGGQLGKETAS